MKAGFNIFNQRYLKIITRMATVGLVIVSTSTFACQGCTANCGTEGGACPATTCTESGDKCKGYSTCPVVTCTCNGYVDQCYVADCNKSC